jgi:SIT family siderophore-iron:H+ symporter-like MFS transporter
LIDKKRKTVVQQNIKTDCCHRFNFFPPCLVPDRQKTLNSMEKAAYPPTGADDGAAYQQQQQQPDPLYQTNTNSSRRHSVVPGMAQVDDGTLAEYIKKPVGVRKIEVISSQYGFKGKIAVFIAIFLVAYAYGLSGSVRSPLQTVATNSYQTHSLLSTINVVLAVVACAAQPTIARLTDVFGRMEIFVVCVILYAVGTVIQSQAYDVQRYAGGSVLYQIGYTGLMLILQLIASDFSFLNWRLLATFVPATPFIINTWISGDITEELGEQWSWGIGMWAIIVPVCSIPLLVCYIHMHYLAYKSGAMEQFKDDKTALKHLGFKKYMVSLFWQIDVPGVILMIAVLALILVPLTLAGGMQAEWQKAKIIAPLVIGFVCIPLFVLWELKTEFPVVPFKLLKDRGVWAALLIGVFINLIWYMQGDYMYTVLIVAVHQSVKSATRISSLYSFVSVITGTLLGFVIIKFRRLKPFIVFGTCTWFIAMGLLIEYRGNSDSKDGIIGALCLMGFGAGFFTYPTQNSIQACTKHEHMAVITALYLAMYNIGTALGGSISGAMWTQLLPKDIANRMDDPELAQEAYAAPLTFIVTYTWGTPEREQLVDSYRYIQRLLCIVGTCLVVPLVIFALFLRDHHLESVQSLEHAEESDSESERKRSWKEKLFA